MEVDKESDIGSTASLSGPPIAHNRLEKEEGDWDDWESPAELDDPKTLANTPLVVLTLAPEFEEGEPPAAAAAELVVVESCGVTGCGCERGI